MKGDKVLFRRNKSEFVKKHLLLTAIAFGQEDMSAKSGQILLTRLARKELMYSRKTSTEDIMVSLKNVYNKIKLETPK